MMKVSLTLSQLWVSFLIFDLLQLILLIAATVACVKAAPGHLTPVFAPAPVVTAQSSQVFARNYNGIVPFTPVPFAPLPLAPAPIVPAPFVPLPSRFTSPFIPSRLTYPYAPYVPYPSYRPFSPFTSPFYY